METTESFEKNGGFFNIPLALYRVEGERAAPFLHGQVTNSIKDLKEGQGNYNLLLTLKGKVVADFYVLRQQVSICDILIRPDLAASVISHLQKMAPLSRVTITDLSPQFTFLHIANREENFEALGLPALTGPVGNVGQTILDGSPVFYFRSDRLGLPGYDLWIRPDKRNALAGHLITSGLTHMEPELVERIRIEQGICKVGQDATEDNLPQEARLDSALHFNKGCYLGQEIIARLHFKGHVNKVLKGLKIEGSDVPPIGTEIHHDGKKVGTLTSAALCPRLKGPLALGYVPYKTQEPGTEFTLGETQRKATVVELPLK